jgi:hypothetical protein
MTDDMLPSAKFNKENMMIKCARWAMLGIGALAIASATAAEPSKGAAQQACKADVERFCASVQRGDGRVRKCLLEHKEQLSTPCKEAVQATASKRKRAETKSL